MAKAAKIVEEAGADLIDINMGCSVPKIIKSGSGAALMKDLSRALEIMQAVIFLMVLLTKCGFLMWHGVRR